MANTAILEALKAQFPQLFTTRDGAAVLDLEKVRLTAGEGNYKDKYGLRWENKPEHFDAVSHGRVPVLTAVPEKSLVTDATKPSHVLIQGDNYHALQVLQYTHAGVIDVIVVDPPYSTGNKDFKYNDKFVDKEDGYRHSKWLSFMSKRLKLARNLLSETGVLFISIDDNEQAALTLLCDEIFGEGNRIGPFVKKIAGGKNDSKFIKVAHEYLLCYSGRPGLSSKLRSRSGVSESLTTQSLRKWGDTDRREDRPNLYYPLYIHESSERIETVAFEGAVEVYPLRPDGSDGRWRWAKSSAERDKARLVIKRKKNGLVDIHVAEAAGTEKSSPWASVIDENTGPGGSALKEIFGDAQTFTYPKNPDYIQWIVSLHPKTDAVVLDFFAGSGTTAQAVMQLNATDNGSRQCILATNDEGDFCDSKGALLHGGICTNVTHPRVTKVIQGYTTPKGKVVSGLGGNLAFFETAFHDEPRTRGQMAEFFKVATDVLCLKSGCFETVNESPDWRVFKSAAKTLFVFFDDIPTAALEAQVEALSGPVDLYTFAYDDGDDMAEHFAHLPNVTVHEIPRPLLDLYKRNK